MVTSYALIVPLSRGEEARRFVASEGIGRSDLKLGRRNGALFIPISKEIGPPFPDSRVERAEFEENRPSGSYKDRVDIAAELREFLPSSYDIVGDLVLIKIPPKLTDHEAKIARAILEAHPNLRAVFADEGVEGTLRIRSLRCLAGDPSTRTTHVEFGARFHVDVAAAYFSPRLANEHKRVADAVRPGETLVDATAGVGPFTVLAARAQPDVKIIAIDLNPVALALLRENLVLNKISQRVDVREGDAREVIPRLGPFHRAVVNLPQSGEDILRSAWQHIAPGGHLHYTVVWPEAEQTQRERDLVDRLSRMTGRAGRIVGRRLIHPYSARDRLYALDVQVR